MRHRSPSVRLAVVCAATALLLGACGDDDTAATSADGTGRTSSSPAAAPATTGPASSRPTATSSDETGTIIEVAVTDGEVDGGGRHEVPLGATVTIRVTSDTTDHVHVHGYDLFGDVEAGGTAEVTFVADIPGVFEVELEDSRIPLVELRVS